ncbi:hypothetical protein ES703_113914 [subsurface metagenome]
MEESTRYSKLGLTEGGLTKFQRKCGFLLRITLVQIYFKVIGALHASLKYKIIFSQKYVIEYITSRKTAMCPYCVCFKKLIQQ